MSASFRSQTLTARVRRRAAAETGTRGEQQALVALQGRRRQSMRRGAEDRDESREETRGRRRRRRRRRRGRRASEAQRRAGMTAAGCLRRLSLLISFLFFRSSLRQSSSSCAVDGPSRWRRKQGSCCDGGGGGDCRRQQDSLATLYSLSSPFSLSLSRRSLLMHSQWQSSDRRLRRCSCCRCVRVCAWTAPAASSSSDEKRAGLLQQSLADRRRRSLSARNSMRCVVGEASCGSSISAGRRLRAEREQSRGAGRRAHEELHSNTGQGKVRERERETTTANLLPSSLCAAPSLLLHSLSSSASVLMKTSSCLRSWLSQCIVPALLPCLRWPLPDCLSGSSRSLFLHRFA